MSKTRRNRSSFFGSFMALSLTAASPSLSAPFDMFEYQKPSTQELKLTESPKAAPESLPASTKPVHHQREPAKPGHDIYGNSEPKTFSNYLTFSRVNTPSAILTRMNDQRGLRYIVSLSDVDSMRSVMTGGRLFITDRNEFKGVVGYEDKRGGDGGKITEIDKSVSMQYVLRKYTKPEREGLFRLYFGFDSFEQDRSLTHERLDRDTFYSSFYYGALKNLILSGAASWTHENKVKKDVKKEEDCFRANLSGMMKFKGNHYLLGGYTNNFGEDEHATALGIAKPIDWGASPGYGNLAYLFLTRLNSSARNHNSTAMLFLIGYGGHNKFVDPAIRGIAYGWEVGTALEKSNANKRNLDDANNPASSDLEDLGRVVGDGFLIEQDFGSGMHLRAYEIGGTVNLVDAYTDGKNNKEPKARIYIAFNFSDSKFSGIPFVGESTERVYTLKAGAKGLFGSGLLGVEANYRLGDLPDHAPSFLLTVSARGGR